MAILKVDTITSADTPTVSITDGASISGVTTFSSDINIADKIVHTGDTDTAIRFSGADTVSIETAGSERLRIKSDGNIIPGTNNATSIGDGSTNFNSIWASTRFRGNDNVKLVLGSSQNLSIRHDGTDNIIGSTVGDDLHIKSGTGDNDNQLIACFKHSNSYVGVGTATPGSLLHLGADSATAQLRIQRTNEAANTNDYGRIYWASYGGTLTGQLSVARESAENNGYMWFGTASSGTLTEKVRITSAGQLQIAPAGSAKMSFYHDSGGSLNHITSNNGNEIKVSSGNGNSNGIEFWDYTGVNKRCQIDAEGIKFNTDTAAANGLDDYEQGSFTPTITYTSGSSGITYSGQQGRYTKIGDTCFINIRVNLSDKGTSSGGNLAFSSLPFTPSTNIVTNSMVRLDAVVGLSAGDDGKMPFIQVEGGGNLVAYWFDYGGSGNYTSLVHGDISNSSQLSVTGFYKVGDA